MRAMGLSRPGAATAISAPRISPLTSPPTWQALSMPGTTLAEKKTLKPAKKSRLLSVPLIAMLGK